MASNREVTSVSEGTTKSTTERQNNEKEGSSWGKKRFIILGVITSLLILTICLTLFFMLRSHPAKPEASALVALSSTPSTVTQGIQTTRPLTSRPSTVTQKEPGTATVTQEEEASTSPSGLSTVTQEEATTVTQEVTTVTQDAQPTVPQSKLIFAQTLFRHGARAPNKKFAELKELFPRGKGQLTDRGYNHSFLLGRFLRKRYVETGFLSGFMKSTEMKWLARQVLRCESTASTVGSGMFQTPEYPYLQVPIVSNDAHFDIYLNADFPGCKEYKRIMGTICPLLSGNYKSMSNDEVYEKCFGRPKVFDQLNMSITESDIYISMYHNGKPLPPKIAARYQVMTSEYVRLRNLRNGIGKPEVIRFRFGRLVDKLIKNLGKAWKLHVAGKPHRKFKVYSTQDWILGGVLDAFSLHKPLNFHEEPGFNSMILIELKEKSGNPFVKFWFKPEEITKEDHKLLDLTPLIPGCNRNPECPLEDFQNCCDSVRITNATVTKICKFKP